MPPVRVWLLGTCIALGACAGEPAEDQDVKWAKRKLSLKLEDLEDDTKRNYLETTALKRQAHYRKELAAVEDPLNEVELEELAADLNGTVSASIPGSFAVSLPEVDLADLPPILASWAEEGDHTYWRIIKGSSTRGEKGQLLNDSFSSEVGVELTVTMVKSLEWRMADRNQTLGELWEVAPELLERDAELRALHARWVELRKGFAALDLENTAAYHELEWRTDEARAGRTASARAAILAKAQAVFAGENPPFVVGTVADMSIRPDVVARPRPGLTKAALGEALGPAWRVSELEQTGELWSFDLEPNPRGLR